MVISTKELKGLFFCALFGTLLISQTSWVSPIEVTSQAAYAQLASPLLSTYQNSTFGITVQYPVLWAKTDLDPLEGGIVQFSAPNENANDTFQEDLEIHYVDLPTNSTLQHYTDILMASYNDNVDNFTRIQFNSSTIAGTPAHLLVFSATSNGDDYKALNEWTVIGKRALIVIYYARPANYLTYLPLVSTMIDSIKVNADIFGKPQPSGTYGIPALGLDVQFPPGWTYLDKGFGSNTLFKDSPIYNENPNSTEHVLLFGVSGDKQEIAKQFDATNDTDFNCGTIKSASIVKINGIKALQSELQCNDGMVMKKIKSYMVSSLGAMVFVGYGASSDSLYKKYFPDFDGSIESLSLVNATDLSDLSKYSSLFKLERGKDQVVINGTVHQIDFASDSKVSNFQFNQDTKTLTFSAESLNKSGGQVIIRTVKHLETPYLITIDGMVSDRVLVINDTTTDHAYIDISYGKGKHDIAIVGSNVVPEYPAGLAILVFGISGATIIFARRCKLFGA